MQGVIERSEMALWCSAQLSRYDAKAAERQGEDLRRRIGAISLRSITPHLPLVYPSSGPSGHLPPQGGKGFHPGLVTTAYDRALIGHHTRTRVYDKTRAFVDIAGSVGDSDGRREAAELGPRHPFQKRGLVREISVVIV